MIGVCTFRHVHSTWPHKVNESAKNEWTCFVAQKRISDPKTIPPAAAVGSFELVRKDETTLGPANLAGATILHQDYGVMCEPDILAESTLYFLTLYNSPNILRSGKRSSLKYFLLCATTGNSEASYFSFYYPNFHFSKRILKNLINNRMVYSTIVYKLLYNLKMLLIKIEHNHYGFIFFRKIYRWRGYLLELFYCSRGENLNKIQNSHYKMVLTIYDILKVDFKNRNPARSSDWNILSIRFARFDFASKEISLNSRSRKFATPRSIYYFHLSQPTPYFIVHAC